MRIRRVMIAALAAALLLSGCDWTTVGFSAAHTNFNPDEPAIDSSNVGTLSPQWATSAPNLVLTNFGPNLAPVVANGKQFSAQEFGGVVAFSAHGTTNCSGTPTTCEPIWMTNIAYPGDPNTTSIPTVANGVLYFTVENALYAFDVNGETNCTAGANPSDPRTCQPLWSAPLDADGGASPPTVGGGVVYVATFSTTDNHAHLSAFDAAGKSHCSGSPIVCAPLWTAKGRAWSNATTPTLANGRVYLPANGQLLVFDAAGKTGCSGTPTVCQPMWNDLTGVTQPLTPAAVTSDGLYVMGQTGNGYPLTPAMLYVFDPNGVEGCSGAPKACTPLWTATGGDANVPMMAPAVANHVVYTTGGALRAFDATGNTNCSGTPKVCAPLWTSSSSIANIDVAPTVANGLVYVANNIQNVPCGVNCHCLVNTPCYDASLATFDANGTQNCTAGVCSPIWQYENPQNPQVEEYVQPIVADGTVYVSYNNTGQGFAHKSGDAEGWKVQQ